MAQTKLFLPRAICLVLTSVSALVVTGTLSGATITGNVIDANTKAPLGSKIVAAYTVAGALQSTASTDSQGRYLLGVPSGTYHLLAYDLSGVYATTFGDDAESFEVSPIVAVNDSVTGINFGLRLGGTTTGSVIYMATGQPLAGMTVAAYNPSGTRRGFGRTGSRGEYSLVLPPGDYKIAAYDDMGAFAPNFFLNQGSFTSATPVSVTAGRATGSVDFVLQSAGRLSGTVVEAVTGTVLPAMTVIAYTVEGISMASSVTDAAGNFVLSVPAGSYKVVAADPTHIFADGYLADANSFNASQTTTVSAGGLQTGLRVPLHRGGTISGHISDASGTPLPTITVAAYNSDGSRRTFTQTNGTGAYTLLLPPGSFRIAAYDDAVVYATQFFPGQTIFFAGTALSVAEGQITPAVDFSLIRGSRFTGAISERATGAPAYGVFVGAFDGQGNTVATATSNLSGSYALVLPAGSYKFVAYDAQLRYVTAYGGGAANYESATVYQVGGNSAERLDFALNRGVRVTGTVVDSDLLPVSGVQIGVLDLAGNRVATGASNAGVFDLQLMPDTYKLISVDPQQRFYPTFYRGAGTLAGATPVVVQSNGFTTPVAFTLLKWQRRRVVFH